MLIEIRIRPVLAQMAKATTKDNRISESREAAAAFFYEDRNSASLEERVPAMFPAEWWSAIPKKARPEALGRCAYLIFRGQQPDEALQNALEGMNRDLQRVEFSVSWMVIMLVARAWPAPARRADGCYRQDILETAERIEKLADAEAREPGAVPDVMAHVDRWQDDRGFAEGCRAAFRIAVKDYMNFRDSAEMSLPHPIPD